MLRRVQVHEMQTKVDVRQFIRKRRPRLHQMPYPCLSAQTGTCTKQRRSVYALRKLISISLTILLHAAPIGKARRTRHVGSIEGKFTASPRIISNIRLKSISNHNFSLFTFSIKKEWSPIDGSTPVPTILQLQEMLNQMGFDGTETSF